MRIDEFNFTDEDECTRCLGLKHHPSDSSRVCPECKGTGKCPHSTDLDTSEARTSDEVNTS